MLKWREREWREREIEKKHGKKKSRKIIKEKKTFKMPKKKRRNNENIKKAVFVRRRMIMEWIIKVSSLAFWTPLAQHFGCVFHLRSTSPF
jgi:hypothetical protein